MPQEQAVRVTPEEIVEFVLQEMQQGICPTYYSNVVPSIYDIYLNAEDLERLRPLAQRMREEIAMALGENLLMLNRAAEPKLKLPFKAKNKRIKGYETLGEWSIDFHENTDDDASENPLVIHSTFPASAEEEDRAGMLTERVSKRRNDGQTLTTSTQRTANLETHVPTAFVYATLSYQDDTGSHTFQMTKDLLKIGRGSADHWVDLKLKAKKDVSREHVQIRRDPSTGEMFIKDLSTLGTTLDGKRLPPSIQRVNGEEVDTNLEMPLSPKARIGLAGVLSIDFKAAKQR